MKKTVNIIITLKGDWTSKEKTERVLRIEGVPMTADHISTYHILSDETTIAINYIQEREVNTMNERIIINDHEYEVNNSTGELIPLCYWLSHDSCILENICCDGKGRCKCIMEEGKNNDC